MSDNIPAIARKLSKAQRAVLAALLEEAPRLLSHRESVSTLAMERVQIRPFIFAQLTIHSYTRGRTYLDNQPTGQLTPLGNMVKAAIIAGKEAQ